MSDRPVRVGVVGAGLMGRWHAHAVARAGGTLVGVTDPDGARASALAARYRTEALRLDDLLAQKPDLVHVCSPLPSHRAIAERCLDAGASVVIEKPVTETADGTEALLHRAERHGRFLCPVHQFLFQGGARMAQAVLPGLGRLHHVDYVACSAGADHHDAPDAIVADILPHPLALLRRFAPAVLATPWQVHRPAPGEFRAVTTGPGVSVSLLVSMRGRPTRNTLRLIAAGGTVHLDLFHGYGVLEGGAVSRRRKITRPFRLAASTAARATANLARRAVRREPAYPGLRELVAKCFDVVDSGGPPPITHDETLDVARARDAILNRQPV